VDTLPDVDDRTLVEAMARRDPTGLEGAYRRYVDALYAYCRALLRDAEAAADVVHDTFIIASQRATDLRDPQRLRAWLYAIARNECLRVLRARRRSAPLDEAAEPTADPVDPVADVHAAEVRALVNDAAAGLSEGDREVIELSVRHGLSAADVGAVLGVGSNNAHARMSRARAQLLRSLGTLMVARTGARDCPTLGEMLHGWDGVLTVLLRKRLGRHIDDCPVCSLRQRDELRPEKLLAVYAGLAFVTGPRLTHHLDEAGRRATERAEQITGPDRYGPDGFPRPSTTSTTRRRLAVTAVAVLVLLAGGTAGTVMAVGGDPAAGPVLAASASPNGSAAAGPGPNPQLTPGGGGPGSTGTPTPVGPPPTLPPTLTATPTRPPVNTTLVFIVPFSGRGEADLNCTSSGIASIEFTVDANRRLSSARLRWKYATGVVHRAGEMTRTGSIATKTVEGFTRRTIIWWVLLTATDGSTFTTNQLTEEHPCSSVP
jgi:RNA polymerase sigma factor (sigma-70 family)